MTNPKNDFLAETSIEIINPNLVTGKIKFAVFDFDGTVSLLRRGWEEIMIPFIIERVCNGKPEENGLKKEVENFVDETTGIQTILQMEGLAKMVKEAGNTPDSEILEPIEYKKIFNERLLKMVTKRIDDAEKGIISFEDQLVPGSMEYLTDVYHRGITMYITSGTDRPDVRRESGILKVDHYFGERIYGALKSFKEYSKEKVINEIVALYSLKGPELIVLGDGPVEIRNGKAVGAITIGVASEEYLRTGINSQKRDRLIKAGADIIIGDFSEWKKLNEYLFSV